MLKLFETAADLGEYLFAIQDNGGESFDRYTVVFSDDSYLGLSGNPTHPQGFSQSGEGIDPQALQTWAEEDRAHYIALGDLPAGLADHIVSRVNEGYADFLAAIEAREPHACAKTREKAKVNQGLYSDGGVGIYSAGQGYCVRADSGDAAEDYGPYLTAAEALRASLPIRCSLSGPEYEAPNEPASLTPTEGYAEWVAAKEAAADAADDSAFNAKMERIFGA